MPVPRRRRHPVGCVARTRTPTCRSVRDCRGWSASANEPACGDASARIRQRFEYWGKNPVDPEISEQFLEKTERTKTKALVESDEGFAINSLTMSYFHTGTRTIIGAEAFHCPVRDGKEWDHLAMVIRLNLSPPCSGAR